MDDADRADHRSHRAAVRAVPGDQQHHFLAAHGYWYAKWLCWADLAIFLGGIGYAFYVKSNDRAKYEIIGRLSTTGWIASIALLGRASRLRSRRPAVHLRYTTAAAASSA